MGLGESSIRKETEQNMEAVTRVQRIAEAGIGQVPPEYIQPPDQRPNKSMSESPSPPNNIPAVDLSKESESIQDEIGRACREWGAFHVINHGVPLELLRQMRSVGRSFFEECPMPDKLKYACDSSSAASEGYGSKMLVNDGSVLDWRDYFDHHTLPLSRRNPNRWPESPPNYRRVVAEYSDEMEALAEKLLKYMSESIGLASSCIKDAVGEFYQNITVSFYPPCPQPELTLGLQSHSDMGAITLLIQDDVEGLQVLKDGDWITVQPLADAIVVLLADQTQFLGFDRFSQLGVLLYSVSLEFSLDCCDFAMDGNRDDSLQSISVKLDGRNYSYWSYVMKNFLIGKKKWSHISGKSVKPINDKAENYAQLVENWQVDNSKIITWINNSVEHLIGTQLAKYDTAKEVWEHLSRMYTQFNFAKKYQLESDIRALQQKDMSIQEFYSAISDLWDQLALTESAELRACAPYISNREEQRLVQFLMALRDDFEGLRSSILHRSPLPSVDSVVSELLADEIRHKSQAGKGILPIPNQSVLAIPSRPHAFYDNKPSRVGFDECSFCRHKGHWKSQCPKLANRAPQPQQQKHQFKPSQSVNQSQSRPYRPPQFNTAAVVPPPDSIGFGFSSSTPTLASLSEQLQKLIAAQSHAVSASHPIGRLPSSSSDYN